MTLNDGVYMTDTLDKVDHSEIDAINEKIIANRFFVPDNVYIDMWLLKDLPLGVIYANELCIKKDHDNFQLIQSEVNLRIADYQKRTYDTLGDSFKHIGYTDETIDHLLSLSEYHDKYFLAAPGSQFFHTLVKHTIRNQNNSRPAEKFSKKYISKQEYILDPVDVTFVINTFPLKISKPLIMRTAMTFGEDFGVNVRFICKDPNDFDVSDWDDWLSKIDCFYLGDLPRFVGSEFISEKQAAYTFAATHLFARKRFDKQAMIETQSDDFGNQVSLVTALLSQAFEFNWLTNSETALVVVETPTEIDTPDVIGE